MSAGYSRSPLATAVTWLSWLAPFFFLPRSGVMKYIIVPIWGKSQPIIKKYFAIFSSLPILGASNTQNGAILV
jgi:hypothetical protein